MHKLTLKDFGVEDDNPRNIFGMYPKTLPEFKSEDTMNQLKPLIASAVNLAIAGIANTSMMDKLLRNVRKLAIKINV